MSTLVASFDDQRTAASAASRLRSLVRGVTVAVQTPSDHPAAARAQRSEAQEMEAMPVIGLSPAPGVGKAWMYGSLAWGMIGAATGAIVGTVLYFLTHGRMVLLVSMVVAGAVAGAVAGLVDAGGIRALQEQQKAEELEHHRVVLRVAAPSTKTLEAARHVLEEMHPQRVDIEA